MYHMCDIVDVTCWVNYSTNNLSFIYFDLSVYAITIPENLKTHYVYLTDRLKKGTVY